MGLKFDFWDNYLNMLNVVVWKQKKIEPVFENMFLHEPLKMLSVTTGEFKVWTLMTRKDDKIHAKKIEVVYSERSRIVSPTLKSMKKLVQAYFECYQKHLTGVEPE